MYLLVKYNTTQNQLQFQLQNPKPTKIDELGADARRKDEGALIVRRVRSNAADVPSSSIFHFGV